MIPTKHKIIATIVLLLMMLFVLSIGKCKAQNVKLQGKVFVQQASASSDSTITGYYYQDRDGEKHPVFLSSRGKAYCWCKSKKTGKMYKRYLPKITEALADKKKE